jgi:hypothetical protein
MQEGLKQQASGGGADSNRDGAKGADSRKMQQAAAEASREVDRQRLGERMTQAAESMRAGAAPAGGAEAQQELAKALDRLGDTLGSADGSRDDESRKLSGQLARAQELRQRMDDLNRQLERLGESGAESGKGAAGNAPGEGRQAGGQQGGSQQPGGQKSGGQGGDKPGSQSGSQPGGGQPGGQAGGQSGSGQSSGGQQAGGQSGGQGGQGGQSGQGSPSGTGQSTPGPEGTPGSGTDVARLREDLNRQMAQVQELMQQLQREDRSFAPGGSGRTFEGQGMTLSSPGTEGFKQDFAKWQDLRRQATQALDLAESTLTKKLQEKESKDRLAAGVDDRAPAAYQQQVDSYFKALATRKKP